MKLRFLATGSSPTHYSVEGETLTAYHGNTSESFDLSSIQRGDQFSGLVVDSLNLGQQHIIRNAFRDSTGELYLTLCQQVGAGHWSESDWIDVEEYDPTKIHTIYDKEKQHYGDPWAMTSEGKIWVR